MPTLEESAAAFRAGHAAYVKTLGATWTGLGLADAVQSRFHSPAKEDWDDGWRSAQREAEIERHIDEAVQ